MCGKFVTIQAFIFNSFEEALGYCIVPTISFPAHALGYFPVECQQVGYFVAGVLHAPIRMENKVFGDGSLFPSFHPCWPYRIVGGHILAQGPADYFSVSQIHDGGQVVPLVIDSNIGDV